MLIRTLLTHIKIVGKKIYDSKVIFKSVIDQYTNQFLVELLGLMG